MKAYSAVKGWCESYDDDEIEVKILRVCFIVSGSAEMRNRGTSPLSVSPRQSLTGEPPWTFPEDDRPDFSALKENIHRINKLVNKSIYSL